jgi:hypothetical protein
VWPLLARRNDPKAGLYQGWELPFTLDRAEELLAGAAMTTLIETPQTCSLKFPTS